MLPPHRGRGNKMSWCTGPSGPIRGKDSNMEKNPPKFPPPPKKEPPIYKCGPGSVRFGFWGWKSVRRNSGFRFRRFLWGGFFLCVSVQFHCRGRFRFRFRLLENGSGRFRQSAVRFLFSKTWKKKRPPPPRQDSASGSFTKDPRPLYYKTRPCVFYHRKMSQ